MSLVNCDIYPESKIKQTNCNCKICKLISKKWFFMHIGVSFSEIVFLYALYVHTSMLVLYHVVTKLECVAVMDISFSRHISNFWFYYIMILPKEVTPSVCRYLCVVLISGSFDTISPYMFKMQRRLTLLNLYI